ncbi:MAG: anti-sigma factor antagonist [Candidatus Omnitrophica bacterium]|nr:anti-sigma factor antagonist [Candidatus Omnitrophota bacterium]
MKIGFSEKQGVAILYLEGNIDINSSDFIETVGWVLNNKTKNILCNMEGVNLVDYIGISVLAIIYKNVYNHKGTIKFCNVPNHVNRLFSIVGLSRVLEIYDNEDKAISSFYEDKVISQIADKKLRRRFKRIPFKNTVEYKQKFSNLDVFYKGKILNLSAIGAFIIGEKIFSIGEILFTKLYLMPNPGIIELDTKVIWVSNENVHPLEYPAMGVEFYNISTEKQQVIFDFVERNLAGSNF